MGAVDSDGVVMVVADKNVDAIARIPPFGVCRMILSIWTWQSYTSHVRPFPSRYRVFAPRLLIFSRGRPEFWRLPCFSYPDSRF